VVLFLSFLHPLLLPFFLFNSFFLSFFLFGKVLQKLVSSVRFGFVRCLGWSLLIWNGYTLV